MNFGFSLQHWNETWIIEVCLYKLLLLTPGISHSLTLWLFLSHVRSHPASSLWIVAPLTVSSLPSPPALHLPCFQSALSVYECRADINSIYYNNHYYFYSYCSFSLFFLVIKLSGDSVCTHPVRLIFRKGSNILIRPFTSRISKYTPLFTCLEIFENI